MKLVPYPIELKKYVKRTTNDEGIAIYRLPYEEKTVYYPVDICNYALANYNEFCKGNNHDSEHTFILQSNWLLDNLVKKDNFSVWEHDFELPYYDFNIPWVHGMAQGMGISTLMRAYLMTDKRKYLNASKQVLNSFEVDMKDGGISYTDSDGYTWYEEYSVYPPPHILNGFIFALLGAYEYYQFMSVREKPIFDKGLKTLLNYLPEYDLDYWSKYNLIHPHPATKQYHSLHVEQMALMFLLTKETKFSQYHSKWYIDNKSTISNLRAKYNRIRIHIKKHGLKNCISLYRRKGSSV